MTKINAEVFGVNTRGDAELETSKKAEGSVTVDGRHKAEVVGGAEVTTEGSTKNSITAVGGSTAATSVMSFEDVMAAEPKSSGGATASAGFKATADASMRIEVKGQANAAVKATGRAVETENSGKAERKS